jgi:predicted nucleic acid-binding protein
LISCLSSVSRRPDEVIPARRSNLWIAACSLAYDLPLATLNIKDSEDFAKHEGLALVSV